MLVLTEKEWIIKEIWVTGKASFSLVHSHIKNYCVAEAAKFVKKLPELIGEYKELPEQDQLLTYDIEMLLNIGFSKEDPIREVIKNSLSPKQYEEAYFLERNESDGKLFIELKTRNGKWIITGLTTAGKQAFDLTSKHISNFSALEAINLAKKVKVHGLERTLDLDIE